MDKQSLHRLYVTEGKSTRECAEHFGMGQGGIRYWMQKYGIKGRPYTENKMPTPKGGKLKKKHRKGISSSMRGNRNTLGKNLEEQHHNWKGGEYKDKDGRIWIRVTDKDGNRRYKKRSRLVMEEYLGRSLTSKEIVHHRNEKKDDDRVENLELMSVSEHVSYHRRKDRNYVKNFKL